MFDFDLSRLRSRQPLALLAATLSAAYWLIGGLTATAALAGVAVVMVALVSWPPGLPDAALPEVAEREVSPASRTLPVSSAAGEDTAPRRPPPDWLPLIEAIPDPAILLSPSSVVVGANRLARDDFKIRAGVHISLALRSPDMLAAIEQARTERRAASAQLDIPVPVERKLILHATPVMDGADGATDPDAATDTARTSLLLVFHDVTEEQQLAQLRADFVANASHELRTPLASVKGFIETLQGAARNDPAARDRFLSIMHTEASRMTRLIDDLLSLSRVEMHEHLPPRDRIDLAEIAEHVAATASAAAARTGSRIELVITERPAEVVGDRDELMQVFQNLVQNAIKYGRDGGMTELRVAADGARLTVSVIDDGIGIAPEHLPRLTERFYRVNAKDSRERGGTGLGLAIVKHIVNRHRGELRIASTIGKGSTFTVSLPRAVRPA